MTIETVKSRRFLAGVLVVLLAAVAAGGALLFTQVQSGSASHIQSAPAHAVNQYSSKFLCGTIASPASVTGSVLAPGTYNTAINIHNANDFDVTIQKKGVISVAESAPVPNQGQPSGRRTEILKPDASMEVDCADIIDILNNSSPPASPGCFAGLPGATGFCKGYLVVEAARIYVLSNGLNAGVPAQLDVTNILTVKEEDGYWKDYTFNLRCLQPSCPVFNDVTTGTVYGYVGQALPPYNNPAGPGPYNLPTRPVVNQYPALNCYDKQGQRCQIYDAEEVIRQSLALACACTVPLQTFVAPQLISTNMATDSRDVSLDFEFVTPKTVRYNCWPKGSAACP